MFTLPLDVLLLLMITLPALGILTPKIRRRIVLGFYSLSGLSLAAYFLYGLFEETSKSGVIIVNSLPFLSSYVASFRIDFLSVFLAFLFVIIGIFAISSSMAIMKRDSGFMEYYILVIGMIIGMVGVVFAGDFFTLFVFWELMSLTSYVLVAFHKRQWASIEASFKYLIMSVAGSSTILFSMSLLYGMVGTLNFATLSLSLEHVVSDSWLLITLALTIMGFGIKAAIVPFHTWLPDAHSAAPSPISALLSGVMVQTGAYALLRILLLVFGYAQPIWSLVLAIFAVLTMFGGNFMALQQDDLKRLLAYSTIAHMGYILFGFATVSVDGLAGSFFHILNHAFMKTLLFLCAGVFLFQAKTRSIRELRGIRRSMPITTTLFVIGTIALAAFPPLNGFWSEILIVEAGIKAEMIVFSALMLANMALSVVYYFRVIRTFILEEPRKDVAKSSEAPLSMLIPLSILTFLCIFIGLFPGVFIELSSNAARAILDVSSYVNNFL